MASSKNIISETDKKSAQKAYKVFVSSTYLDNKARRRIVQEAITMAGMVWYGMEIFTASTRPTVEECLRYAGEADLLVGIIARRYGWEPEGYKKSITEIEYDAATERLMFLIDPTLPVHQDKDYDPGPDRWDKQKKLDAFKERFFKDQMPAYFYETTLQAKVLASLNKWRAEREQGIEGKPSTASSPKTVPAPLRDPELDQEIKTYCQKAEALHSTLPVAGFVTQLKVRVEKEITDYAEKSLF